MVVGTLVPSALILEAKFVELVAVKRSVLVVPSKE
jgi:hypothetical protein